MSNLKDKVKDRQSRMDEAIGDAPKTKKKSTYEDDFDEAVTKSELMEERDRLKREVERQKKDSGVSAVNEKLLAQLLKVEKKLISMGKKK